jgi:hypothetical protein
VSQLNTERLTQCGYVELFLPTDGRNTVRAIAASAMARVEASSAKKRALDFNTALVLIVH